MWAIELTLSAYPMWTPKGSMELTCKSLGSEKRSKNGEKGGESNSEVKPPKPSGLSWDQKNHPVTVVTPWVSRLLLVVWHRGTSRKDLHNVPVRTRWVLLVFVENRDHPLGFCVFLSKINSPSGYLTYYWFNDTAEHRVRVSTTFRFERDGSCWFLLKI